MACSGNCFSERNRVQIIRNNKQDSPEFCVPLDLSFGENSMEARLFHREKHGDGDSHLVECEKCPRRGHRHCCRLRFAPFPQGWYHTTQVGSTQRKEDIRATRGKTNKDLAALLSWMMQHL
jgi:hypothetical protein